jgi:iron complex transport system substrate-binding protein
MGREVSLPGPAVRIVSLAASNTEILFSIDAGPQTAGRDDFSDQPAEAQALPSVGGTDGSYDMELFTDLAPDLVLLGGSNTVDQINAIEDAGFTYYYVHDPATLEDFFKNIGSLGILTGQETAAESLVTSLQDRVDIVISTLSGITERPIVFYEREVSDTNLPWTCGRWSIINELLFIAGATNAAEGLDGDWVQMRLDALTAVNPDLILLGDTLFGVTPEDVLERPGWENIRAVYEYRIIPFDDTLLSRPGPGLIEGLESLAATIHPDRFN